MQESFLYHVWQFKLFNHGNLFTNCQKKVEVMQPGTPSLHSGPDFDLATLRLDDLKWVGAVEIHVKSSDWNKHKHEGNAAYKNVILHVVWEHDLDYLPGNHPILELKGRVSKAVLDRYKHLAFATVAIPCENYHPFLEEFLVSSWLNRMLIERLETKTNSVNQLLQKSKRDWDEVAYQMLFASFGMNQNKAAFQRLAELVPHRLLVKYAKNKSQQLALLLGVAGLINQNDDNQELSSEFEFLSKKHRLIKSFPVIWKLGGVRPAARPVKRIEEFIVNFPNHSILTFWIEQLNQERVNFNIISSTDHSFYSEAFRHHVWINAILPSCYAFALDQENINLQERVIHTYEMLNAEKNSVIKKWKSLPLKISNAAQTQGLLNLYSKYCSLKRCLNCALGNAILRNEHS